MATIADLLVKIGADTSDLRKELNATKRQIKTAFGSEALDVSKKSLAVLGGIGAGLAALGVASVKAGASLQSTKTAFTNMLGSAEKAQDFLESSVVTNTNWKYFTIICTNSSAYKDL